MEKNNDAKYVILLGDGMADLPIEALGGRTPLEYAGTPNMDRLAAGGIMGVARTVPDGMQPGSDIANLSILGYDPRNFFSGRAPLEALNMGIDLGPKDLAIRCNMVDIRDGVMEDFSAGHIASEFSAVIMKELGANIDAANMEYHPGVSYRNIVVWRNYPHAALPETTPPHDIQGKPVKPHLPRGAGADVLNDIMVRSAGIIASSRAVGEARSSYKGTPTSVWLWGCGKKPAMTTLFDRFGLRGHTISAVDLVHGLGRAAGLTPIPVPGATGFIDTNYEGKAQALLRALPGVNFIFLHVESPDESGHEGNLEHKLRAIEDFDRKIVGPVMDGISSYDNYTVLMMPDHPTPISIRTHSADPVPFAIYSSGGWKGTPYEGKSGSFFNEKNAAATGLFVPEGHRLIELMLYKKL
ncbi:MAG TPA: cofactor-independent phosphoglycerate mutase [Spirochaetota bacterium]|nr:cofactor-independent phosphoglycerate mutase [Spirochaetota bacterium]HPC41566.1 cofactor-independent phosphoglycerate mutase [Spirochaetota bacterium]HPL17148.1 cofactor-independent phosphoglycerate mutase [Spirochaetota bacterium]HQF08325.1 cofactor-independent phosphoglycerate mutase [Spirochaetota bacterium]HQH97060.1 cofactor-independent phosphoglycerate mutase [Spirochaetota bacterium]